MHRAGDYQIATADRIDQRRMLTGELTAFGVPFAIALVGGLALFWLGIGQGLRPLALLGEQIHGQQVDDTRPLHVQRPPAELRPVVQALDGLLERLTRTLAAQRAFTDAAAHELRTPLTVIDTHLQVARAADGPVARASLDSAGAGVRRLRRFWTR